ncbi:hypothetical protein A1OK_12790 [Enterovibrio norvegicus FF-454]|uniref:Uncharacterized protein n=1 Tax=Enterovibrio norvegicus FF-454 TaxID=1185651 RepID=A0A1E5C377_9GAMM|nr:hypothetical protein [Enterovibrio norvegicus]OEE59960.1 hypothetical protein A1OK_12790 [Enterovibrio norvegicus FF-454]
MTESDITLVILAIVGTLSLAWIIPGIISFCVVSLGSFKHIIYLDRQLSRKLNELYDEEGNLKNMNFLNIGGRFITYCFTFPFIQKHAQSMPIKYKVFMWLNSVGFWSLMVTMLLAFLVRHLHILS